jgi:DNA polymerase-4
MTEQRQLHHAKALAIKTKKAITSMVGECLTSSVGLASNMLLAKVAADMQKPNGLTVILPEHLPHALYGLKLSDIPGIGRNMLKRLYRHSVYDMESLLALDSMRMRAIWGGVQGARFHAMLHGKDVPKIQTHTSVIGHQHVLEPRLRSRTGAFVTLQKLLTKAAERMRNGGHYCRAMTVQVKLTQRLGYFEGKRHFHETQDTAFLLHQLQRIWRDFPRGEPLRVGVTLHDLIPATAHQLEMFDAPKKAGALSAIDAINKRYGRGTISFGIKPEPKESVGFDKIAFSRVPSLYEAG